MLPLHFSQYLIQQSVIVHEYDYKLKLQKAKYGAKYFSHLTDWMSARALKPVVIDFCALVNRKKLFHGEKQIMK